MKVPAKLINKEILQVSLVKVLRRPVSPSPSSPASPHLHSLRFLRDLLLMLRNPKSKFKNQNWDAQSCAAAPPPVRRDTGAVVQFSNSPRLRKATEGIGR